MGGSVDLHPNGTGQWCVSGALEFDSRSEAEAAAREYGCGAYAYESGYWEPPPGVMRLEPYSPKEY